MYVLAVDTKATQFSLWSESDVNIIMSEVKVLILFHSITIQHLEAVLQYG